MPQLDRSRDSTSKLIVSVAVDGDYYGGSSAAVPFKWESQPGTPRRLFKRRSSNSGYDSDSDSNSPVSAPLTPPPSYYAPSPTKPINPKKTNNLFVSLLSKNRSALSSSSSSSSPTSSVPSSPLWTPDLYGRNRPKHCNGKSSGCYASIIKVMLLRDVK